jgi:hypothetical protein
MSKILSDYDAVCGSGVSVDWPQAASARAAARAGMILFIVGLLSRGR